MKEVWEKPVREKKLVRDMISLGKGMIATSQIVCPESVTSATLQGWIRIALERRILGIVREKEEQSQKRRDRLIEKGENFREIEEIVGILDGLLSLHS